MTEQNGPSDANTLAAWIGHREERTDLVSPGALGRFQAALDHEAVEPAPTTLWHWAHFRDTTAQSALGDDGHPARGRFLPPVPLPRRMFAGFRLRHRRFPHLGQKVRRHSTVTAIESTEGRHGPLVFVTVEHRVFDDEGELLVEEEDLVYTGGPSARQDSSPDSLPDAPLSRDFSTDPTLLFRFSAVLFNSHRIHYDVPYATEVEGYPGLVVQGPLIAALLADLAVGSDAATLNHFEFQARRPVFVGERILLRGWPQASGREISLTAFREDGAAAARARASCR